MKIDEARAHIDDIQIGWYWTFCCNHDMSQIQTTEELAQIVAAVRDDERWFVQYLWPSWEAVTSDPIFHRWQDDDRIAEKNANT